MLGDGQLSVVSGQLAVVSWRRLFAGDRTTIVRYRVLVLACRSSSVPKAQPYVSVPKAQPYVSPGWSRPSLARAAQPWGGGCMKIAQPQRGGPNEFSIPNVPFIDFDPMSLADFSELVLEGNALVVFLLVGNVTFDLLDI